tara:strand:- start:4952 stop:6844 length:1893 start_codon:yes stop_codon:yes gene_type:complete
MEKVAALDFETYYSKDYSIRGVSTYQYVNHPEFDAYMVSIYCDDFQYVGELGDFDWKRIDGFTLIAHNASFDQRVFERCQEQGKIPSIQVTWECSADMCVYFQYQRHLKGAAKEILGVEMDKEVRENMKGKTWEDLIALDESKEVMEYALNDAKYTYQIWENLSADWPEEERKLSRMTRKMAFEGFSLDIDKLMESKRHLLEQKHEAEQNLPWFGQIDPDTKKEYVVYSKKALAIECRKLGIEPPKSLAKDSEELKDWLKEHGEKLNFVVYMQLYNRINHQIARLQSMEDRLTPEDRMSYNLKYWGADVTGRWSGDSGLNVQNLPRDTVNGVNVRRIVTAPEGYSYIVSDLANIEPRMTAFQIGDSDTLDAIRGGMSIYEAHARMTMGWTGGKLKEEDPDLYTLAKVRVLQLGYGSGWAKFADTVAAYGQKQILDMDFSRSDEVDFLEYASKYMPAKATLYPSLPVDERRQWVNAWIQVMDFRNKNSELIRWWKGYDGLLKDTANEGGDLLIDISSGRQLKYFRCRHEPDGVTVATQKGSIRRTKSYGANIFQNTIQALARDCFAYCMNQIADAGFRVVLHVHDEVVVEVEDAYALHAKADIQELMSQGPEWMKNVPLEAEAFITKEYCK